MLNLIGGYTRSVNSYSNGTSVVILPHIVGSAEEVLRRPTSWPTIVEHTDRPTALEAVAAELCVLTHDRSLHQTLSALVERFGKA